MANQPPNAGIQVYTWEEFEVDARKIADTIKAWGKKFKYIYGPPRGGVILAVKLSHLLCPDRERKPGLPNNFGFMSFYMPEFWEKTLVVDDIADTGQTLWNFNNCGSFIVTLFKHPQSTITPDIWIREKDDRWVQFPWEAP
ncbi:MAG: hypothetical protein A3I24_00085 [Candidatus Harrisonbacteria bacterium RIFCSPLOWO2_02_FULL_41_13b]|uniref:Phosphoribosyltransferase domain-containing protein n=1 Tax=Candidatus Harrisonbacteria bacterium RIFCSPLOWO2_02_FULL_41_13b TaxID=1798409 RepID=A0A1G1ZSN2_9BACT|nr:MAG: hypothetical protein A3J53_00790 [Candidatus Harrisonbacteria bacterium RIFCSPHIGHO2_02_FULL_40_20]OGY67485.1 MAG: hypothetical protein A3I24_00085 [Candidatus Harrisonbacteria bacterium RIFCSPLOWO2_02_FULL_41_13b]